VHPSGVRGVEDLRLIAAGARWYGVGTTRDRNPEMRNEAVLWDLGAALDGTGPLLRLDPGGTPLHEKNWMPFVADGALHLVQRCHPLVVHRVDLVTGALHQVVRATTPTMTRTWRGGSQGLPVGAGRWLFAVHEVGESAPGLRTYAHRLVLVEDCGADAPARFACTAATPRFTFTERPVEFCAGLAREGDDLVMSFGVDDAQGLLARAPVDAVLELLEPLLP
jgi:hypothetical protein